MRSLFAALLVGCASEPVVNDCTAGDLEAVADHEIIGDVVYLDASGSTACADSIYGWWVAESYSDGFGGHPWGLDGVLEDDAINGTNDAIYAPMFMLRWGGQHIAVTLVVGEDGDWAESLIDRASPSARHTIDIQLPEWEE